MKTKKVSGRSTARARKLSVTRVMQAWQSSGGGQECVLLLEWADVFRRILTEGPFGLSGVNNFLTDESVALRLREDGCLVKLKKCIYDDILIFKVKQLSIDQSRSLGDLFYEVVGLWVSEAIDQGPVWEEAFSGKYDINADIADFLRYIFFRSLGMPPIPVMDDWIALYREGFYLLDVPHFDLDRLDLRRDGIFLGAPEADLQKAARTARPVLPRLAFRKSVKQKPLWLRNAIFGREYLLNRFFAAASRTQWITESAPERVVVKSFGREREIDTVSSWHIDGVPTLFQRGENISMENYDAASLEKLVTWADKKLGACFTTAKPYDQEYYWCDPWDDDAYMPEGMTWDPTTCTLVPEDSAPTPAEAVSKSLLAKYSSLRSAHKNAVKAKSTQRAAKKPVPTEAESKPKRTITKPATSKRTSTVKKTAKTRRSSPKSRKRS